MKKLYKPIALLLCLAMVFALVACGNRSSTAEPNVDVVTSDSAPVAEGGENSSPADAPESAAPAVPDGPTTLVYGADAEMAGIDPFDTQNQGGQSINEAIYERLIEPRDDGTYVMRLASGYEWQDDNTLVFTLREGIKFQDGADFTAEDALCSIRCMSEVAGQASRFTVIDLENSYCDGDYTLVIKTAKYYAPLIDNIARVPMADYDWVQANPDRTQIANGTGPYMLKEWNMGNDLVLEKNPTYWDVENIPYYDTIDVRFFTDGTTAFLEFESGNLDVCYVQNSEDVQLMNEGGIPDTYLASQNINAVTALNMSQLIEDSPYKDENLRLAIAHAIDWQTMISSVCGETVVPATSILPSADANHVDIGFYEYNPEKAKEYAEKYKAENKLDTIDLPILVAEKDYNVSLCVAMQAYLAEAGINLQVESGQLFDIFPRMLSGEVYITINQLTGGGSSHNTFMSMEPGCKNLVSEYTDPEICDLIVKATETKDEGERAEIYKQIQQLNFDGAWAIPMYEGLHFFAAKNTVQGIHTYPSDYPLQLRDLYAVG